MNYQNEPLSGLFSAILGLGVTAGRSGYAYYQASEEVREQNADLALANAVNTATARKAAKEAKYAANRAAMRSEIDEERQKRYLLTGAAIGVPVLLGLVLFRKGGKK